jgi:hypothetical protein
MNLDILEKLKVESDLCDSGFAAILGQFHAATRAARMAVTDRAAFMSRDFLWAVWYHGPKDITVEAKGLGLGATLHINGVKLFSLDSAFALYGRVTDQNRKHIGELSDDEVKTLNAYIAAYQQLQRHLSEGGVSDDTFGCAYPAPPKSN